MNWDAIAADSLEVLHQVMTDLREPAGRVSAAVADALRVGGRLLICGNGGSAADAQHMAGELVGRFLRERRPYAAMALTVDSSILTAVANDYSFDVIFERQVRALGRTGDILLGFSTSGGSVNLLRAFDAARELNMITVAVMGDGGPLAGMADHALRIRGALPTPRIQEGHHLLMHLLCESIEEALS